MRVWLLYIFLSLGAYGFAQYNSEFMNFEYTGRSVSINSEFDLGSNAMTNEFINKFIFGGYIDNGLKDKIFNKMKGYNVAGGTVNLDISTFFGRSPKYSFLIGVKDQELFNATFTQDFFGMAFYGNKKYLGQTANFSGTNINALRFQELKFGIIWHQVDTTAKIGASLSIVKGEQLFYIKANQNSSLTTNADGTDLTFVSNFNMALSDSTLRRNIMGMNGIGASADIFFETPYKSNIGIGSVLTVNANNIGFIHWFDNSVQYSSDSTFHFDGYHVNNIYDLSDSTLKAINADTIVKKATNARREAFNTNIPTNLIIINKINFTTKFALNLGFRYIFHANNKPYLFTEGEYKFSKQFMTCLHVGYGGYSRFNVGLAVMYNTKSWFIKAGSNSVQGFLFPKNTYGQNLFLSIAKKFKN